MSLLKGGTATNRIPTRIAVAPLVKTKLSSLRRSRTWQKVPILYLALAMFMVSLLIVGSTALSISGISSPTLTVSTATNVAGAQQSREQLLTAVIALSAVCPLGELLTDSMQDFATNFTAFQEVNIPAPRLVCVESNPGPKGGKKAVITVKKGKKKSTVAVVRGRGDYSISENIGGALGRLAGKAIGSIFGSGAYTVKGNTLHTNSVPQFAMTKNGNEFAHREFVADIFSGPTLVSGATVFNLQQFIINPADEALFPWVSQIAENYEMYELLGLIFEYVPASGNAVSSTNAALGTVIMATQYNSLDAPFTSKRQMESYEFATSTVPSMPMLHPVECASQSNTLTTLYVNNPGSQTAIGDPRFANIGTLNIATVGQQAAGVNLGELWVTAHIRFKRPRLAPSAYTAHFYAGVTATPGQGCAFFATAGQYLLDAPNSSISGISIVNSGTLGAGVTVTWPVGYRGTFQMIWNSVYVSGGTGWLNPGVAGITYTGGLSGVNLYCNIFGDHNTQLMDPQVGAGQQLNNASGAVCFMSDGTGGSFTLKKNNSGGTPANACFDLVFSAVATGIST